MANIDTQMKIRLPDDLKQAIDSSASTNNRSINAEVVYRLEQTTNPVNEIRYLLEQVLTHMEKLEMPLNNHTITLDLSSQPELKEYLEYSANSNKRSITSEIIAQLKNARIYHADNKKLWEALGRPEDYRPL